MVHPEILSKDNEAASYGMIEKNSEMQSGSYSMPQSVLCFKIICIYSVCTEISGR